MIVVPPDYNAATPSGSLWMDFPHTRRVLDEIDARPGDWIWATDTEVLVGAQLDVEPTYRLVAVPHRRTLVHLDDYDVSDVARFAADFKDALRPQHRTLEDEERAFRMLMVWSNKMAPPVVREASLVPMVRATVAALFPMGECRLILATVAQSGPELRDDPYLVSCHLKALHLVDPGRAAAEVRTWAADPATDALVLAACIDIATAKSELVPDPTFGPMSRTILDWIGRFDRAPGRDQVSSVPLSHIHFNRGLILLRLGIREEAREAFRLAHQINPNEPAIVVALALEVHDERAPLIAAPYRDRPSPVAA